MKTGRVLAALGGLLFALPVIATWRTADVSGWLQAGSALLLIFTAIRPIWGLAILSGLLPVGAYIWAFSGRNFSPPAVAEMMIAPFLLAASARIAIGVDQASSRLARPALLFGAVTLASAVIGLALQQQATAWPSVFLSRLGRELLKQYFDNGSFVSLSIAIVWIEGLALAVLAERVVRGSDRGRRFVVAALLTGAAIAAAGAWMRLWEISLRQAHPFSAAIGFLHSPRINTLYTDVNAAGSLWALLLVPAVWLAVSRASRVAWLTSIAVSLALWLTHSRAAIVGAFVSLALLWFLMRRPSRTTLIVSATLAAALLVGIVMSGRAAVGQSGTGDSLAVRLHMAKIGLQMTADRPLFGVGLGQFRIVSRAFMTPDFVALFPQAGVGENAHNNFIQILAEVGLVGLAAFLWLLAAAARAVFASSPTPQLLGLAGGVLAFLLSCLLGHPFMTVEVLWIFFLVLGVTTGFGSVATGQESGTWGRRLAIVFLIFVVASTPVRVWQERRAADLGHVMIGVSGVVGTEDEVDYRLADARSVWYVTSRARMVEIPLRLTSDSRPPCLVQIDIDGRQADSMAPLSTAWQRPTLQLQPTRSDPVSRRLDLRVEGAACHLMVGGLRVQE